MRKNKLFIVLALVIAVVIFFISPKGKNQVEGETIREITPSLGTIETVISTTGTVLPKNRLEVKPPVNGRVDSVLVQEGEKVKAGQILAWMSSTERAALLDAARGKGEDTLKYWQEVYKAIPLLSPLDGEVIVATTQPAQTVTTADPIVVLSDHLIVRAQVDETDIGKILLGQEATIGLDAYPEEKIKAGVEHIYYESQTVNNVTIYLVDLLPEKIPSFFRSGMNATVDFKEKSKENMLLLPMDAVQKDKTGNFVLVDNSNGKEPTKQPVTVGMTDEKNIEILSGLTADDTVIIKTKKFNLPKNTTGTNPFMPARPRH
jgi:macrolide-specific efflux system membrane fusion protein